MSEQVKKRGVRNPKQVSGLVSFNQMSPEKHREISRKGGIACQEKRKQNKTLKEAAQWLMQMTDFTTENEAVKAIQAKFPDLTTGEAMAAAVMKKVIDEGDARAFAIMRDTSGELPVTNLELGANQPMTINIRTIGAEETK